MLEWLKNMYQGIQRARRPVTESESKSTLDKGFTGQSISSIGRVPIEILSQNDDRQVVDYLRNVNSASGRLAQIIHVLFNKCII